MRIIDSCQSVYIGRKSIGKIIFIQSVEPIFISFSDFFATLFFQFVKSFDRYGSIFVLFGFFLYFNLVGNSSECFQLQGFSPDFFQLILVRRKISFFRIRIISFVYFIIKRIVKQIFVKVFSFLCSRFQYLYGQMKKVHRPAHVFIIKQVAIFIHLCNIFLQQKALAVVNPL